jgi:hypothetical protein
VSATAQSVIRRAVETLQDETSVRWTIGELARYFNDGRREVVMFRPDATATVIDHALVAGPRQTLPADGAKLLEVFRNTNGRAVRLVEREILDAQVPGWPAMPRATEIVHFMFDRRDPRAFLVYPPAAVGASLQLQYATLPVDIAEPTSGGYSGITGALGVPQLFANALTDYVLYRAFSKDGEHATNATRAAAHYALFTGAVNVEIGATAAQAPTTRSNPNASRPAP